MSTGNQIRVGANIARDDYGHSLRASYSGFRIYDPDYATVSDKRAWQIILRDARVAGMIMRKLTGIAGAEYPVAPKTDSADDTGAAEMMQELVDEIDDFHGAIFRLATAKFRGDSWEYMDGGFERMRIGGVEDTWWVCNELLNADRFRFRQVKNVREGEEGNFLGIRWQMYSLDSYGWEDLENPEWFVRVVFDRSENTLGYGSGWMNLLAMMYYYTKALELVNEENIDALQRYAQGILHIKIDEEREGSVDKTNDEITNEWITIMKKHLGQHILAHSKRDEVDMIDGPTKGHEIIKDLREYLIESLAFLITFGVLPAGAGNDTGSNARASEEGDQMHEGFVFDRKTMAEGLTKGLLTMLWNMNEVRILKKYPTARMPHFEARLEKVASSEERLARLEVAARNKIPIREEDVYEDLGYSVPVSIDDPENGIVPDKVFDWANVDSSQGLTGLFGGGGANLSAADHGRGLMAYLAACAKGETSAKTGCSPAEGPGGGKSPEQNAMETTGFLRKAIEQNFEEGDPQEERLKGGLDSISDLIGERVANGEELTEGDKQTLQVFRSEISSRFPKEQRANIDKAISDLISQETEAARAQR